MTGSFTPLLTGLLALVPVFGFLGLLHFLDTYRLLSFRRILLAIGVGIGVALVSWVVNAGASGLTPSPWYPIFGAPLVEEVLKGVFVWWQIRQFRLAFQADSATTGFAVGTGFALVENLYYAWAFAGEPASVWVVRAFGTAVMHGGSTALFGIVAVLIREKAGSARSAAEPLALVLPVAIHVLFNSHLVSPLAASAGILAGVPILLVVAFQQGEASLRRWVRERLDQDIDLVESIAEGTLHSTRYGQYLSSLLSAFPPMIVADMVRVLELRAELSLRAKGNFLRREVGLPDPEPDAGDVARLEELNELGSRIGRTGMLALRPLMADRAGDLWEIRQMGTAGLTG